MKIEEIHSPADIKNLSHTEMLDLADQIRQRIIQVVGKNGGHLASNLGSVELSLALHRVFDSPKDAIIWDVSHQSYTHKILTGRNQEFDSLRQNGGLSGFTRNTESEHDFFSNGHASVSISQALGLSTAMALQKSDGRVIAVIGDGALTGGMAFEALSHAGQISKNLIVVLNDNRMSISKNTGSISRYLSRLSVSSGYQNFRFKYDSLIGKLPFVSGLLTKINFRFKRGIKSVFFPNTLFSDLGFEYVGPLNGHNMEEMETVFSKAKKLDRPVVIHVLTKKGRGYKNAEENPTAFHGVGPFDVANGIPETNRGKTFTQAFSEAVVDLGRKNEKVVAITAAMSDGTGLSAFESEFPDRFFDVGIAEEHAVTFAGGLARGGLLPVTAIYSTFMQRSVDQLIHDVALQKVPGIFALDRSGAVPGDGETHQGIFDISLLRPVPDVTLLAPASECELKAMIEWASVQPSAVVIRYPKAVCPEELVAYQEPVVKGRGVLITDVFEKSCKEEKCDSAELGEKKKPVLFVCTGGIAPEVLEAARNVAKTGECCHVYNLRFLKPLDKEYFINLASRYKAILFVEDGLRIGGIGTYLESLLVRSSVSCRTGVSGFHDTFVPQGNRAQILEYAHLSPEQLARKMINLVESAENE